MIEGTPATSFRVTAACPRALLFDFGGTLDAAAITWKERMLGLFRAEGLTIGVEHFDAVFYRADDALVGAIPPTLSFAATVRWLVGSVGAALGVGDSTLTTRIAKRFLEDALVSLHAQRPLLSRLASRYALGVVSNFYGNLATVCTDAGLGPLFRVIIDSTTVGVTKPDPRIFRHALDALGVAPAEATFVGDSLPRDMVGARGIAMPHIWLIGAAAARLTACCPRDPMIRSLDELQGLLL